jgi:hypothetical protein
MVQSAEGKERQQVERDVIQGEERFGTDFLFHYLHARIVLHGVHEHQEAFSQLFKSAQIAIRNGDATTMLRMVSEDSQPGEAFARLSRGHAEWSALRDAIRTEDERLVMGSPSQGHSH